MAKLQTYQANESVVTGSAQSEASPGAFGAQEGAALQDVGGALVDVGGLLAKRRKEGEAIWADNVVTNAEIEWNKKLQDAKNNAGDGAPNFTGNVLKEWDKFSTNTMKSAPTGSAERILSTHLNNLRQRIIDHAQQFEATERVAKQVRDVEYNVNQKVALAALDPTRTMELMGSAAGAVGTINGIAPASKVNELSQRAREQIFAASIEGQLARGDTAGALARLTEKDKSGNVTAAKYLGGAKYVSLLTEAQARQAHANAFDSMQAQNDFKDNIALIEDGFDPRAGFNAKDIARRLAGQNPDKFDAVYKEVSTQITAAHWTAFGRSQLRGKSESERALILANMAADPQNVPFQGRIPNDQGIDPTSGELVTLLGYDDARKLHSQLVAWNKADVASMTSDPVGYFATNNPDVKQKYQAAAEISKALSNAQISNPSQVPQLQAAAQTAFHAAIESNLVAQTQAGIAPGNQQVLSLQVAKDTAAKLMSGDVNNVEPMFQQLSQEYGPYYTKVLQAMTSRQLPEGDRLSPLYAEIGESLGQGSNRLLISALREMKKNPDVFNKVYPTSKEEEAARAALYGNRDVQKFQAAVSINGAGASYFDDKMQAAQILAKQFYREGGGKSVDRAVSAAVQAKFTGQFNFIDDGTHVVLVPKTDSQGRPFTSYGFLGKSPSAAVGGTMDDIYYNLENRKRYYGSKPADYFSPEHFASLPTTLSSEQKGKLFNYNLQNNSFWKTTEDRRGVELWMQMNGPGTAFRVLLKDGRPIYHDFDHLAWDKYAPALHPNDAKALGTAQ